MSPDANGVQGSRVELRSPLAMLDAFREFSEDFEREADQPLESPIEPNIVDAAFKRVQVA